MISGGSCYRASTELKNRILKGAAELLEADPEDLDIREGRVYVKAAEERGVAFAQAVRPSARRWGSTSTPWAR